VLKVVCDGAVGVDLTLHLQGTFMPAVLCSMQHAIVMEPLATPMALEAQGDALATAIVLSAKAVLSMRQIVCLTSHIMSFEILPLAT